MVAACCRVYFGLHIFEMVHSMYRTFAAICEDPKFHISKIFVPGDIEIISNQVILHSRGDLENGIVSHP